MQSMPNLKHTDPHDVFAIESLLHAHAEKMPHAEKAPPLAHDPAAPAAAPPVHVAPPISVGAPGPQVEPTFSAPAVRDLKVHDTADNAGAGEIKVDALKALDDPPTARWVKRAFMALLGLVGAVAAAGWQHYGDDATAMAAEWTPSFVLAALPGAKPAVAEQPGTPAAEVAATDQPAQSSPAAATAPAQPEQAAAAAPAPAAEPAQLQSMAHDLAAMGQQIEELKATIAQLKASQAQMARELAKVTEAKATEARAAEAKAPEARAAVVAPPAPARPAAPPPVRKPKPVSSHSSFYSPAPMAAAPPPMQIAAPPPPPQQTIADDGEPVVRPPMPLR